MARAACRKALSEKPKHRPDNSPKIAPDPICNVAVIFDGHVRTMRPAVVMATPNDLSRSIDFPVDNAERGVTTAGAADAGNANV